MTARLAKVAAAVILIVLSVGFLASPAFAHAELESTTPANGEKLAASPPAVILHFNEPVEASIGSIRVLDSNAKPVGVRGLSHVKGDNKSLQVELPKLGDGLYVASWRITSADSHPVQNAITFGVGDYQGGGEAELSQRALAAHGDNKVPLAALTTARVFEYGGLVLASGYLLFWFLGWDTPRSRRIGERGAVVVALATYASIIFQGAVIIGGSIWDGFKWSAIAATVETRFGILAFWRAAAMIVFWFLMAAVARRLARYAQLLCLLGVVGTIVWSGHAAVGKHVLVGTSMDIVHVIAMCVWLGGLGILVFDVMRLPSNDSAPLVARFSRIAMISVIAIVGSGLVQSWRQVGNLEALRTTDFGQTLMIKTGLVIALVALGWFSRLALNNWRAGASAQRLGTTVALEAIVAIGVLIAASFLVNEQPAKAAEAKPMVTTVNDGGISALIIVDPAKVGTSSLHIYANTYTGKPAPVEEAQAKLSLQDKGIAALNVPLTKVSPYHHASYAFDLPARGTWKLTVTLRTSDVDQVVMNTDVKVK